MSTSRPADAAPVQAVHRAMDVLELLADAADGLTVLQVSETLEIEKSVASRLLATLLAEDYLVRDPVSGRYELTMKLMALVGRYADRIGFPATCQPILQRLSDQTHELIQLSAVERESLVLVALSRASQRLTILPPRLGSSVALHATASGKAWLASMSDEQALELALATDFQTVTPRTVGSAQELLAELNRIRHRGYATSDSEFIDGVNAVAFTVGRERFGTTVGVVALSAPAGRLGAKRVAELAPVVESAASELEVVWPLDAVRLAGAERPKLKGKSKGARARPRGR